MPRKKKKPIEADLEAEVRLPEDPPDLPDEPPPGYPDDGYEWRYGLWQKKKKRRSK